MDGGEPKPEEAKAAEGEAAGSEEESGEDERDPAVIQTELLEACRVNN